MSLDNIKKEMKRITASEYNRRRYLDKKLQGNVSSNTNRKMTRFRCCGLCFRKDVPTEFHHFSYVPNIAIEVCHDCHIALHHKINDNKIEWDDIIVEKKEVNDGQLSPG